MERFARERRIADLKVRDYLPVEERPSGRHSRERQGKKGQVATISTIMSPLLTSRRKIALALHGS